MRLSDQNGAKYRPTWMCNDQTELPLCVGVWAGLHQRATNVLVLRCNILSVFCVFACQTACVAKLKELPFVCIVTHVENVFWPFAGEPVG